MLGGRPTSLFARLRVHFPARFSTLPKLTTAAPSATTPASTTTSTTATPPTTIMADATAPTDALLCLACHKQPIEYGGSVCQCPTLCKKCAMRQATGGKCKKCGMLFGDLKRVDPTSTGGKKGQEDDEDEDNDDDK
ncbi:hypothetical protein AMAG_06787 [Allomyces macrogynus ATCC 38327]|uniref:Uncharacterized protein n=1 Tax=Allomyces macrogynus (strain ATCC 38327) TaxID=578462 RepID=A0A0L0SF20_ALLM3|nr:hypothetical protein AMAG_06787 [Allomyces macrogynus ATCC 38327]|eukprot:KNE61029.1 hypothetical protein AMAG_06787 [Allomyces macrogynus ATCC 38327]